MHPRVPRWCVPAVRRPRHLRRWALRHWLVHVRQRHRSWFLDWPKLHALRGQLLRPAVHWRMYVQQSRIVRAGAVRYGPMPVPGGLECGVGLQPVRPDHHPLLRQRAELPWAQHESLLRTRQLHARARRQRLHWRVRMPRQLRFGGLLRRVPRSVRRQHLRRARHVRRWRARHRPVLLQR
jgi:hypothetical protein